MSERHTVDLVEYEKVAGTNALERWEGGVLGGVVLRDERGWRRAGSHPYEIRATFEEAAREAQAQRARRYLVDRAYVTAYEAAMEERGQRLLNEAVARFNEAT